MQHNFDEQFTRTDWDSKKHSTEFYSEGVIPMWIADTDFKAPQPVIDAMRQRVDAGVFGYTVPSRRLREAAAGWYRQRFGWTIAPEHIHYSPGVVAGIVLVLRALTIPGDNVVVQAPCYTPFMNITRDNGRNLLFNPLRLENGRYELDFVDLECQLSQPRTRILILSNPQNPSGRVFTREELQRIGELCLKHHVFVISDEIHCDFIYPGHRHIPFGSLSPAFSQNSISFINPSKTFNLAGLHTAVMLSENTGVLARVIELMTASKMVSENIFGSLAFATAYEKCAYYVDEQIAYLDVNRHMAEAFFSDIPEIDFIMPEGTYLFWLDCRKLGLEQPELVSLFRDKARLGLSDGLSYSPYGRGFMRLNAACTHATMAEALRRIRAAL